MYFYRKFTNHPHTIFFYVKLERQEVNFLMKDIHYQEDDFEKAKKSIGNLIGKGAWGKGAIDCLKDASKNLEEVEKDIRTYDSDGAISFQHTDQKAQYQELFEDFDVLYRFSDQIGEIVKNTIDRPFYEKLDDFVEGMRNLDATTFTTENRIGATRTSMEFVNSSTQKQVEVPKSKVSLDDLFSGSAFYANQMKAQFDAWKKTHKGEDVSRQDFQAAMLNSRAFTYTSIKDEQQKQEFWVNIAATVVIIGVAVFCPPAGLALGATYGVLEMGTALTGKDWVSGRELDTSERAMRGSFALLDVLPGVKALSGGVQTMRTGSRLASLSDTFVHGVKSAPTQLGDITKIGQTQIRTRIKSLKNVTQDALQSATQKGIQGLDKVGQTATTMKGSLNLPPRQNLALAGMGGIPTQAPSQITQGTENLKDILQKFDVNLSGKGKQADGIIKGAGGTANGVPTAFKQMEFTSSYETRIGQTPAVGNKKVQFEGARGESLCTLKPPPDSKLESLLKDAGVGGVTYKNGVPDFTPFSKAEVEIDHMLGGKGTMGNKARDLNFQQANSKLAKELNNSSELAKSFGMEPGNIKPSDIEKYRVKNNLTWHELNDCKTIQLVPSEINSSFGHLGGVGEINTGAFIK